MTAFDEYTAPEGLRTRGTILIVPGRGESRTTYRRLGRRLAADAYHVRVLAPSSLEEVPGQLAQAVEGLDPVRPVVLLGADTGAAAVTALVAAGLPRPPDGVVAAGLPGFGDQPPSDWDQELQVRTHCPAHRGVLTGDPSVRRGALSGPAPRALLAEAYGSTSDVPHLFLIGDADPLADPTPSRRPRRPWPPPA